MWDSDDSESESESESEDEAVKGLTGRARWLKRTTASTSKKKEEKRAAKQTIGAKEKTFTLTAAQQQRKAETFDANMKESELDRKVLEVISLRGRKQSDTRGMMHKLSALARLARRFGPRKELPVLVHLLSSLFDTQRTIDDYMSVAMWRQAHGYATRVLLLLEENPSIRLGAMSGEDMAELMTLTSKGESAPAEALEALQQRLVDGDTLFVGGSIESFLSRLAESYVRSLRGAYPDMVKYAERVRQEPQLLEAAALGQKYFSRIGDDAAAARLAQLQVEFLYYRHEDLDRSIGLQMLYTKTFGEKELLHPACLGGDSEQRRQDKSHPAAWLGRPSVKAPSRDLAELMASLCATVYKHGDSRSKTRCMLCHIFHTALRGDYYAARDLLLMSHLQRSIAQSEGDVDTQILFNRMMATLGLSAFRAGLLEDAQYCLQDLCAGRAKDLLAQGVSNWRNMDAEAEKAELRRQVPFHMHVNLDLLECVALVTAMVVDVPLAARGGRAGARGFKQRSLVHFLQQRDNQIFLGPPETNRDHVVEAAKCLGRGDHEGCERLVLGLKVWRLLPGEGAAEKVREMLRQRIRVEALRTFLFAYGKHYKAIARKALAERFDLSEAQVYSIASKLMIEGQLKASWQEDCVVLHRDEASKLQTLASALADKVRATPGRNASAAEPMSTSMRVPCGRRQRPKRASGAHRRACNAAHARLRPCTRARARVHECAAICTRPQVQTCTPLQMHRSTHLRMHKSTRPHFHTPTRLQNAQTCADMHTRRGTKTRPQASARRALSTAARGHEDASKHDIMRPKRA